MKESKENMKVVDIEQMSISAGMKMLEECLVESLKRDEDGGVPLAYGDVGAISAWFEEHQYDGTMNPEMFRDVRILYKLCEDANTSESMPKIYLHAGAMLWRWFKKLP